MIVNLSFTSHLDKALGTVGYLAVTLFLVTFPRVKRPTTIMMSHLFGLQDTPVNKRPLGLHSWYKKEVRRTRKPEAPGFLLGAKQVCRLTTAGKRSILKWGLGDSRNKGTLSPPSHSWSATPEVCPRQSTPLPRASQCLSHRSSFSFRPAFLVLLGDVLLAQMGWWSLVREGGL